MIYKENIFTQIANKEISVPVVYENEEVLIFPDKNPQAPTHLLCIPKKSYVDYLDYLKRASLIEQEKMEEAILSVVEKYQMQNSKIIINQGKEAGQIIFHFHVHLLSY